MKVFSKIAIIASSFSLAIGVGIMATSMQKEYKAAKAAVHPSNSKWTEVTALTGLNTSDYYTFATNDGTRFFNGSISSGHFQSTAYSSTAPANISADGVVKLESVSSNTYKIKLASTSKYVTASKAASGGGVVNSASDSNGWQFSFDSGFEVVYQKSYSGSYATFRSYSNSSFRTYASSSTNGDKIKIYKYVSTEGDTLNSLTLSGSMNTQYVGTAWDPAGIIVTGNYQNQGAINVTSSATFTYNPATPTLGVTSVSVTASFGGKTATKAYDVVVEEKPVFTLVSDATLLTPGTTFYLAGYHSSKYYVGSGVNNNHIKFIQATDESAFSGLTAGSTLVTTEGTLYTLEGRAGNWQITDGTKYLAFSGTSNGDDSFVASNKDSANAKFTISSSDNSVSIINNTYNQRALRFNNSTGDLRNYGLGTQNPVYMFANIAPEADEFGTLDHITLTSAPNRTYFHVGEQFNSTGLLVTAFDGANEDTAHSKNVTNDCTLSFANGTTFGDSDAGDLVVTVSYSGKSVQFTLHVYRTANYRKVTATSDDLSGQYLIVDNDSEGVVAFTSYTPTIDGTLYANATVVNEDSGLIATGKELEVTLAKTASGYSIQLANGKYLDGKGTDNGITINDEAKNLTITYDTDHFEISTTSSKKLAFNTAASEKRFRFGTAASDNLQLYKLEESYDASAVTFAQMILDDITCNNGVTPPSTGDWEALTDIYNDGSSVTAEGKLLLKNTMGDASIVVDSSTSDINIIKAALAKYDYIVGKYGKATYSDFLNRDPAPISPSNNLLTAMNNNNNIALIAVIASAAIISGLALFFIIKRRKTN